MQLEIGLNDPKECCNPNLPPYPYPYGRIQKSIIIWSLGPDGQADGPSDPQGKNKDNIKSWEN